MQIRCKYDAKLNSISCWTDGLNRCKIDGCENQRQTDGVCFQHGAVITRCKIDGCENVRVKDGVCIKHGAVILRCKINCCENQRVTDGVCMKHGAVMPRLQKWTSKKLSLYLGLFKFFLRFLKSILIRI